MTAAMTKARELHDWEGELPRIPSDEEKARYRQHNQIRYSITEDDWGNKIHAFHLLMRQQIASSPSLLSPEAKTRRIVMLLSELNEFATASTPIDLLDGVLDICYVALGAAIEAGFSPRQILLGMEEVHASNMTKVQDDGSPLINDGLINPTEPVGKVLKTHNYIRPDIAAAIAVVGGPAPAKDTPDA